jgi:hypothetical protein
MESKTPEELATEYSKMQELAQGYDSSKFIWPPAYFTKEELREAWLAGYAAALPKWVSVEERLPEPGTWVLIYLKHKREYWADEIVEKNRKVSIKKHDIWYERRLVFFENEDEWEDEGVTDWLSFPTPPTKEP